MGKGSLVKVRLGGFQKKEAAYLAEKLSVLGGSSHLGSRSYGFGMNILPPEFSIQGRRSEIFKGFKMLQVGSVQLVHERVS